VQEQGVTIFSNLKDTTQPHHIKVGDALHRIKTGKSKELVEKIRVTTDKETRNKLKQQLPCICFSGTFSKRADTALIKHSGLMVLDFDDLSDDQIASIGASLVTVPFIYAMWISPSGNGLKALVRISHPEKHRDHFLALKKEFPKMDQSGKDISRVCYESYDPDIYINEKAKEYSKILKKTTTKVAKTALVLKENSEIYTKVKQWLEKEGCHFAQGNRNNYIMRLAAACNRFGIPQSEAYSLITQDFLTADSDFSQNEMETVIKSIYTKFEVSFKTAEFEESGAVDKNTRTEIKAEILDLKAEPKDIIYLNDVKEDLIKDFTHGTGRGETTYFPAIDNHFRWMRGEVTLMGGHGNYGKTNCLMQLLLIKSVKESKKWAIFCPENSPPIFFYKELIRTYIGKSVDNWSPEKMSRDEFNAGMKFVNEHFYFIYPKNSAPTPDYMANKFLELVIKKKIDGCVIDPFNQLENSGSYNRRDDQYIGDILSKFSRFAKDNNVYFIIIAHPKGGFKKLPDGNYECPDVYDLSGGAIWNAKIDNILMYHRPFYQTNKNDTTCEFRSQKIKKQMLNGIPGNVTLDYDRNTGRFFDNGYSPFQEQTIKKPSALEPPVDFTQPIKESDEGGLPF